MRRPAVGRPVAGRRPAADMALRLAPQPGEVLDRTRRLTFTWDGRRYPAYAGDTIVSALAACGERVFSRSFKYHRPRGLLTASYLDPGCLVQVGDEPNVRGAHRRVANGMAVRPQNAWPSLRFDVKAANNAVGRFLTAGFYYKTFMKPERLWPAYERVLQRFAAGGSAPLAPPGDYYDKRYAHPDVLVAGGGPAGMAAAVAAVRAGASVLLVEEEHDLGGHLRWGGEADLAALADLRAEVAGAAGIEVLTDAVVAGRYDHNWVAVVQRSLPQARERLVKARAKTLVVAPGLIERPYVFAGNDLPGVLLSTAARRLINLYAVKPGERAVVLTANADGDAAVADLKRAGVEIARVEDARLGGDVVRARGRGRLRAVEVADGAVIECDLLVTATGWTAPTSLLNMAGDRPVYRPEAARFVPERLPDDVLAAGGVAGDGSLDELVGHAAAVGAEAARRARRTAWASRRGVPQAGDPGPEPDEPDEPLPALGLTPHPALFRGRTHGLVDFSEDVTSKDLFAAVGEGYDSVELVKRYTTATMGPAQGKLETVNTVAVVAEATGRSIGEVGTTVWRPPYAPVSLGALAGRIFEPVRYSPMQPWHERHGAVPLVAGAWIRPDHYGDAHAEVRRVRERVGIIDVTPIGKLDLRGPDVAQLLNLLYVNKWSKLEVGRVRYGVMCAEDGVVFDDGVTGRLADDHYIMSTTSSGAAAVWEWIESWLQTERPGWQVHVTPVTTAYASMNVAGPAARELMARVSEDVDLSPDAFGYMNVRQARVAGVDGCFMWRIGFTGELSYELHVPAAYGLHVWETLMAVGADLGIGAFGVEAQRIMRLEKGHFIIGQDTDGLTRAWSAGIDWAIKLDKDDFAGKPELVWQHDDGGYWKLVALQPHDPQVVPPEASQIVDGANRIVGRITSSRHSPTIGRAICLGFVAPQLAGEDTGVRVLLPDGRRVTARVMAEHAHFDPDGTRMRDRRSAEPGGGGQARGSPSDPRSAEPGGGAQARGSQGDPRSAEPGGGAQARGSQDCQPVARSPVPVAGSPTLAAGWEISARSSDAALTLVDCTPLAKVQVRADHHGAAARALGVPHGSARRDDHGVLLVGSGPGEWLALGPPGTAADLASRLQELVREAAETELVTVLDVTHGRALLRLSGEAGAALLAKICAIDLSDAVTPDGAAFSSSVARLVTDVIRDDREGVRSYLLHCETSSGAYLWDALLDAGREFGIAIDGFG